MNTNMGNEEHKMYMQGEYKGVIRVGFISTRLQGTDGVSLETGKWVEVFTKMGFECYFFAGLSNWDSKRTMVVPEAFWEHPEVEKVQKEVIGKKIRDTATSYKIHKLQSLLKKRLYNFISSFSIDLLVIENALAIPMNIALGLAITEVIAETGIVSIAHHHDFYWERSRFLINSVPDYISMAFPPRLLSMVHVVINSEAQRNLSYRKGISSIVIPNVHNYHIKVPQIDEYNSDFRKAINIEEDDILFLQPTRIVARKGIEHAIELVHRMQNPKIKILIGHQIKDEGKDYYERICSYANLMNVNVIIRPEIIGAERGINEDNQKIYSIWDIYPHVDFVTYPSTYEGFGNAFLEAIYFQKPIMVNRYSIFIEDIEPLGFNAVVMDTYITDSVVQKVNDILHDPVRTLEMVQSNFKLAKNYFGYDVLEQKLRIVLMQIGILSK